jgi:hypothetical protein
LDKKKKLIIFITFFIVLSFVKLFTAKVGLLGDPTVQLVIKSNPTISNSFIMKGEENEANRKKYEGTWYYERNYKFITGDEAGFAGESFYDLLIIAWWILVIGMPIYLVINRIKSKGAFNNKLI